MRNSTVWKFVRPDLLRYPGHWLLVHRTTSEKTAHTYANDINNGVKVGDNVVSRIEQHGEFWEIWAKYEDISNLAGTDG